MQFTGLTHHEPGDALVPVLESKASVAAQTTQAAPHALVLGIEVKCMQ